MRRLLFGRTGPEREAGMSGEWVDLTPYVQGPIRLQDVDPIRQTVADLVRRYDPGGYRLCCPVAGCGWQLDIPRMELDPTLLDIDPDGSGYTVSVEGVPREDVERILAAHLDWHACASETGAQDAPEPPAPEWARRDLDLLHDGQDEARATAGDEP